MTSPGTATAPRWHDEPPGLRSIRLRRFGPLAPSGPYAVVDVETTGLDPALDRVVEIAVVRCDASGRPVAEWSSLIDPGRDPGPTAVHGITGADLAGAPPFAAIAERLATELDGAVIAAHNLAFDASFLAAEWALADVDRAEGLGLCTLTLARALHPGRAEGYSLAACSAAAGIPQPEAHRALADARVTADLLGSLVAAVPTGRRPWPRRRLRTT